jgi:hypothetical protein
MIDQQTKTESKKTIIFYFNAYLSWADASSWVIRSGAEGVGRIREVKQSEFDTIFLHKILGMFASVEERGRF